jgi:hypothetical protein
LRWAFALSNAGARYVEARNNLAALDEIDWNAVQARDWQRDKEGKQAEFLVEKQFAWELVSRIGVQSRHTYEKVITAIDGTMHKPRVEIIPDWYY